MAKRHSDGSGQKGQLNRRDYMRLGGATLAATTLGGVGATTAVAADPDTVVDLGEEGLTQGDEIDSYLEEYVENGVEVRVPQGEYDWNGEGFTGAVRDAAIIGQGEVILNNVAGRYYQQIRARSGTVEIRNFTIRGRATGNGARFRLQTNSSGKILVDNVNFPDGSEEGAKAKAFYAPRRHAGVIEIRNCYFANFDDNGIYANSPGASNGEGGQVIVENCTSRNNNIAGIRVGSDDSIVRNCLVINDEVAPASRGGTNNQRGIRVRSDGDNLEIADCEIIHSFTGTGAPIQLHRGAAGGSGTISNVKILNNTDNRAIFDHGGNTASGWEGNNISITGDGDLRHPSHFDVTTGSDAEEPTGEDPQGSSEYSGTPEVSEGTDELRVMAEESDGATYEFTATDEIRPLYDLDVYNANRGENGEEAAENDDGTWTATGALSGSSTSGDTFEFDGFVTAFDIQGATDAVTLYLNGRRISKEDLVAQSDEDYEHEEQKEDASNGEEGDDSEDSGPSESSEEGDWLRIMASNSGGATYEFTATDEITPLYDLDVYNANRGENGEEAAENDDGTWTATGALSGAGTSGDTFEFRGQITAFSIDGDSDGISLYLNDDEISIEDLVVEADEEDDDDSEPDHEDEHDEDEDTDHDEDELTNVLMIDGTVSNELAQYKVVVSGRIEQSDSLSSVVDGGSPWDKIQDRVDGSTATGVVAKGLDGYRYSGELVSFQVSGNVDLTLEELEQ